jgi:cysteine desulfurase
MIYADHNGSTPILPAVKTYLQQRLETDFFANPNSIHSLGQKLHEGLEYSRREVAEILGAEPNQVIFNSGATEGINNVVFHLCWKHFNHKSAKKYVYISSIEHAAVTQTVKFYQSQFGFVIHWIPVSQDGMIDLLWLKNQLSLNASQTAFVSCIAANNETGVYQPYIEIQKICQELQIDFFSDTTQILGKESFNFQNSQLDFAILSGHKIGALPGTGALLVKNPEVFTPFIFGGGQENELRSGTQNYLGIETLTLALQEFNRNQTVNTELKNNKLQFEKLLRMNFPEAVIIGEKHHRLSGTTLVGYPGFHGQGIQIELEAQDIFVTTSSACSDNQPETSAILKAMGVHDDLGRSVIRISMGPTTSAETYHIILKAISKAYNKFRKIESHHVS